MRTSRCSLRIYTYPTQQRPLTDLLSFVRVHGHKHCGASALTSCQSTSFWPNNRQYSADVLIWQALLRACSVTEDPNSAQVLVVPFLFGTASTLDWGMKWPRKSLASRLELIKRNGIKLLSRLSYLNASSAARHLVIWTTDVQFIDAHLVSGTLPWLQDATFIHLGDDLVPARAQARRSILQPLRNSITVPYRIRHWCPFGFPPPARRKQHLLLANINPGRHVSRARLVVGLKRRAIELGIEDQVLLPSLVDMGHAANATAPNSSISLSTMMSPLVAAERALESNFCLCPTGDSKGFTSRFYFSIVHGCLPVRYDGWRRQLNATVAVAYPFTHRIDWARFVVEAPDNADDQLLDMLLAMPADEVRRRLEYMQSIAPLLIYTEDGSVGGAANALIEQLERRFSSQTQTAQEASMTAGPGGLEGRTTGEGVLWWNANGASYKLYHKA